ncbi:MAG: hypothetical protein WBM24_17160, partial [Candidatus Sulfotelmatobacter sp.]
MRWRRSFYRGGAEHSSTRATARYTKRPGAHIAAGAAAINTIRHQADECRASTARRCRDSPVVAASIIGAAKH